MLDRLGYILIVGQGVGNVRKRELGYLKQGIMVVIDLMVTHHLFGLKENLFLIFFLVDHRSSCHHYNNKAIL